MARGLCRHTLFGPVALSVDAGWPRRQTRLHDPRQYVRPGHRERRFDSSRGRGPAAFFDRHALRTLGVPAADSIGRGDDKLLGGFLGPALLNCVINLSVDKPAVLTEMARVLRAGGRLGISDVVAEDHLSPAERAERGSHVGCIAGALSRGEYIGGLEAAGFEDVSVEFTHEVADGMHGAIVKAVRSERPTKGLPIVQPAESAGCC